MRIILFVALAVTATAAIASEPKDAKAKNDPNQVICRTNDVTGSRLQKERTCLTRQQWDQQREELKRTVQRVQDFKPQNGG